MFVVPGELVLQWWYITGGIRQRYRYALDKSMVCGPQDGRPRL